MKILVFFVFLLTASPSFAVVKNEIDPTKNFPTTTCGGKQGHDSIRIAGFYDYPPFSWATYDEDHFQRTGQKRYTYHGFVIDPVNDALKKINVDRVDPKGFPVFEDTLKAGKRGQVDILFTAYYQDDSQSGLDYIYPSYFGNPFVVISRADKKIQVSDPAQLSGLKGVIRLEEGIEPIVKGALPTDVKITVVEGPEKAFKALLSGEVDFMISSPFAAAAEARRFKVWKDIYIGSEPIRSVKVFASFSKMSKCRKYKDVFAEAFSPQFTDKTAAEAMMQKAIDTWAELHKDDPPLEYAKPVAAVPAVTASQAPAAQ